MGEIIKLVRDVPPLGYIMKIEPFSLLSKLLEECSQEHYESREFEVGGYNWKMMIYPNGNKKNDVCDYISVYLAMSDTKKLTYGSEVNALVKFFVFDQIKGKYVTFEEGRCSSFSALKNVRGISRMLSLDAFRDPANGYLRDDCCTFGVEVMVIEPHRKGEKLTIAEKPDDASFSWKILKFSTLKDEMHLSDEFTIGGFKWKLKFYPMGCGIVQGKSASLFLAVQEDSDPRSGWKVHATFGLIMKDQLHDIHWEKSVKQWFCASNLNWGYQDFILLADLKDIKKGFLVNDNVTLEVKITFMSVRNCSA